MTMIFTETIDQDALKESIIAKILNVPMDVISLHSRSLSRRLSASTIQFVINIEASSLHFMRTLQQIESNENFTTKLAKTITEQMKLGVAITPPAITAVVLDIDEDAHRSRFPNETAATNFATKRPTNLSNLEASRCILCGPGMHSDQKGQTSSSVCKACGAGQSSVAGSIVCTDCSVGKYSAAGASTCTGCPVGKTTGAAASTGASSCDNLESRVIACTAIVVAVALCLLASRSFRRKKARDKVYAACVATS